ncbi:hypothetical protein A3K34_00205 [candidate division WWE3 bacterium RIFOXYC1_FULL_40_10]|uniref:Uncharacterized protein n=1 Tax=candidate division WWE3 bacterium RIFOXYA2_FULL_46_9 TaxID=1802636 RepID=A0A1F4W1J5_UNCKA|nr:MAG: hypothetical protein A3K58_00205 [candidate division WWE3 bacterium RIFOXYB1_FULL_40_22]OGC61315.1 MAG: hypothetical protein A3K37_00205 [candidate division WWE3 bacterium RIFOXYA1_FULL_40_11]OGC63225.1 MAG: hypothetical protein A2264_00860 [candidate division WWE3 bacterium RIFOXYA2_FULL_46_9]OGC65305.1 MAG: hypothetical protein A2326_04490 [candidate division WWE3 bacterium RIFOXYB2_FULL_41_6]OGC65698.1 MAG: hypothetical protein A3K34_00205 [candidate division WWE3 bacterium RIFOXYC1_
MDRTIIQLGDASYFVKRGLFGDLKVNARFITPESPEGYQGPWTKTNVKPMPGLPGEITNAHLDDLFGKFSNDTVVWQLSPAIES